MALPAIPAAATWAAPAASVVGQAITGIFQGGQNRKNRKFSREMYERSFKDSSDFSREMYSRQYQDSVAMYEKQLQDQIRFWEMQNAYNEPSAEMARLKAAGLNPALMYGSGAQANRAGDIGKPSFSRPSAPGASGSVTGAPGVAPRFDLSSGILAYNQTRLADKQMAMMDAEIDAKRAQALKDTFTGNLTAFDLEIRSQAREALVDRLLAEGSSARSKALIDSVNSSVQYQMFETGRSLKGAIADQMYKELRNRNMNIQYQQIQKAIENIDKDINLKDMEIRLRKATGQSYGTGTIIGPVIRALYNILVEPLGNTLNELIPLN